MTPKELCSWDAVWEEFCEKQPRLRNGSEHITFTVQVFRQLMRGVYERGRAHAVMEKGASFDQVQAGRITG